MFSQRAAGTVMVALTTVLVGVALVASFRDSSPVPVTEDDPGWDCSTDGNRVCGPSIYEQVKRAQCDVWLVTLGHEPSDSDLSVYAQCLAFEEG